MKDTLSARDAASLLGVKLPTLYAYVSRGQIQSVRGQGRARRYRRGDVERLMHRRAVRRGDTQPLVAGALSWGPPVLDSSISEVTGESTGNVGWLIHVGLKALRVKLGAEAARGAEA